jgi:hypothetical protein
MAGGHDYLPHACSQVLENGWGDCKDKATLLATLGQLYGLPVHLVKLTTETTEPMAGVGLGLFNHVICALDDNGELVFMDPTDPMSELGDPPAMDLQARAFLVDPKHPRYVQVTALEGGPSLRVVLDADLDGLQQAKARITASHAWRSRIRNARHDMDDRQFQAFLARRLEKLLPKVPMEHFQAGEDSEGRLALTADADLSGFLTLAGNRVLAPRAPFQALEPQILDREKDAYAIQAQGPQDITLEVNLTAPGLKVTPERLSLGREGGPRHTAAATGSAGRGKLEYHFSQPFRLVPQDARAAFLAFCGDYQRANRNLFRMDR